MANSINNKYLKIQKIESEDIVNNLPPNILNSLQRIKEQFSLMQYKSGLEDIEEIVMNLSSNVEQDREEALKKVKGLSWFKIWDLSDDCFIENHSMNSWLEFIQKTIKEVEKYIKLKREINILYENLKNVVMDEDVLKEIKKNIFQLYNSNKQAKQNAHNKLSNISFSNDDYNIIYKQILNKSENILKY